MVMVSPLCSLMPSSLYLLTQVPSDASPFLMISPSKLLLEYLMQFTESISALDFVYSGQELLIFSLNYRIYSSAGFIVSKLQNDRQRKLLIFGAHLEFKK